MYEGLIYFEGPLCKWSGQVDAREVIYRTRSRFLGVAIGRTRGRAKGLQGCGWCVLRERPYLTAASDSAPALPELVAGRLPGQVRI